MCGCEHTVEGLLGVLFLPGELRPGFWRQFLPGSYCSLLRLGWWPVGPKDPPVCARMIIPGFVVSSQACKACALQQGGCLPSPRLSPSSCFSYFSFLGGQGFAMCPRLVLNSRASDFRHPPRTRAGNMPSYLASVQSLLYFVSY